MRIQELDRGMGSWLWMISPSEWSRDLGKAGLGLGRGRMG